MQVTKQVILNLNNLPNLNKRSEVEGKRKTKQTDEKTFMRVDKEVLEDCLEL